jgi:hypothetical protein
MSGEILTCRIGVHAKKLHACKEEDSGEAYGVPVAAAPDPRLRDLGNPSNTEEHRREEI